MKIEMKTPITYYGGKQSMLKYILPLIPEHSIYTEAFFGGGAVFFAKKPVRIEFINDHDGEVINFYKVVKEDFPALKKHIDVTLYSEFQHKLAKHIYHNPTGFNPVLRAWAIWVLSHQSFNAVLTNTFRCAKSRSLGRQNEEKKAEFDERYTHRLENTTIFCCDAINVIRKGDSIDTFHYVDPPYFNADMGHYGGYTRDDFEKLLITLSNVQGKFMLSSYNSDLLAKYIHQNGWNSIEYDMYRSSGGGRRTEVLTMNYDIAAANELLNAA